MSVRDIVAYIFWISTIEVYITTLRNEHDYEDNILCNDSSFAVMQLRRGSSFPKLWKVSADIQHRWTKDRVIPEVYDFKRQL